jgi:hypothetical protein
MPAGNVSGVEPLGGSQLRYLGHEAMTARLRALAAAHPHLAALDEIGRSHQGREIWAVTLTAAATGAAAAKPALYVDANNHGEEVITAAAALYAIGWLLDRYGRDPAVTELLETRALYVLPCINPDGAEICLTSPYRTVGNGRYPPWAEQPTGLHLEDVDGDGQIRQMRIPDPKGEWTVSGVDPRLMTLRGPGEIGGEYFRLLPEGIVRGWDGVTTPIVAPRHGNLNRQFPVNWLPESGEYGAGELPLNEPEAAAVARFLLDHPNITGVQALHSHGGVILRPSGYRRDAELPAADVDLFAALGAVGTRLTGYPLISTFEDFTENRRRPRHGTLTDWTYEQLGLPSFSPELWDVATEAGIAKAHFFPHQAQREADEVALLRWCDAHCPAAHADWRPFDHPQFGAVALGGWDPFLFERNPPPAFVERVAAPIARFIAEQAAASPLVRIGSLAAEPFGDGFFRIAVGVENRGYLPTNLTDQALSLGIARPVTVRLDPGPHAERLMGDETRAVGHLAGRVTRRTLYDPWRRPWGDAGHRVEWLVRLADADRAELTVRVEAEKGGADERALTITRAG